MSEPQEGEVAFTDEGGEEEWGEEEEEEWREEETEEENDEGYEETEGPEEWEENEEEEEEEGELPTPYEEEELWDNREEEYMQEEEKSEVKEENGEEAEQREETSKRDVSEGPQESSSPSISVHSRIDEGVEESVRNFEEDGAQLEAYEERQTETKEKTLKVDRLSNYHVVCQERMVSLRKAQVRTMRRHVSLMCQGPREALVGVRLARVFLAGIKWPPTLETLTADQRRRLDTIMKH